MGTVSGGTSIGGGGGQPLTRIEFGSFFGPTNYAAGGFVLDLTTTFSSITSFLTQIVTQADLYARVLVNNPTPGKVKVILGRARYDKTTSLGTPANQPAGISIATSATSTNSHTFGTLTTGTASNTVNSAAGLANTSDPSHRHSLDIPDHSHNVNFLYTHNHGITTTVTPANWDEPVGENLSAVKWHYVAGGV